jgi:hypothetical protein
LVGTQVTPRLQVESSSKVGGEAMSAGRTLHPLPVKADGRPGLK